MGNERKYVYSFDVLRVVLVLYLCVEAVGIPGAPGAFLLMFRSAVPVAFFVISGFLVLGNPDRVAAKLPRAVKRTAIMLASLVVFYFIATLIFAYLTDAEVAVVLRSKRKWFEFIVMNLWPFVIGESLWFIHCLLYSYIAVWLLGKCKLLRYDWIIISVCMIINLLTGEFAGLTGFNLLGYHYLNANVITRGIPYLLIGRRIWMHQDFFAKANNLIYILLAPIALCLTVLEFNMLGNAGALVYYGHSIGNGLFAVIVVLLCAVNPDALRTAARPFLRSYVKFVYIFQQTAIYAVQFLILRFLPEFFSGFQTMVYLLAYMAFWALAWLVFEWISYLRYPHSQRRHF